MMSRNDCHRVYSAVKKCPNFGSGEFLPRDALIARYMLWLCLSVSLCVSVTSRCSTETAQWIELIFGMEAASFDLSYTVL